MSIEKSKKAAIDTLMRSFSARTIMLHDVIAEVFGVNATDLKCLDIAMLAGKDLTAGELAELSGLTTGAITGVIDRLEKANLVRRERDLHDRRRVIIVLTHARDKEFEAIFSPLGTRLGKIWDSFSPAETAAITRFIQASNDLAYQRTIELRQASARRK